MPDGSAAAPLQDQRPPEQGLPHSDFEIQVLTRHLGTHEDPTGWNNDLPSGLFFKFIYSISVSKYGVIVYLLYFIHLQFALVKILANLLALIVQQKINACSLTTP